MISIDKIKITDLFHDVFNKEVEDLQLTVKRRDEPLIGLNPHDNLWKHVVPTDDIDPAALRSAKLTLQLGPEASPTSSENTRFECVIRDFNLQ